MERGPSFFCMDTDRDNAGSNPDNGAVRDGPQGLSAAATSARETLRVYLDRMQAAYPQHDHPDMDFLDALLENGMASAREQTAAEHPPPMDTAPAAHDAPAPPETETIAALRALAQSMETRFGEVNAKLSVQDTRNFCTEVTSRQAVQTQREKDRKFWSNSFVQPMARFHAMDLFDGQAEAQDLANHASLVAPPLASNFGTSASDSVGQVAYDPDKTVTYREIAPVWNLIGRLLWNSDRRRHVQQMAGTSKVGYVTTYQHIHRKLDGNASFSGSRTDREHWATERFDVEKEILREKAHEKQLAGVSGNQSKKKGSKSHHTNTGSGTSDSSGGTMTNRQKHNKKQRKIYLQRKKAKAAQAKADGNAAAKDAEKSKQ